MGRAGRKQDRTHPKSKPLRTASFPGGFVGAGGQIGPYKLLRVLGEGGLGIVYLAEQREPVKRQVALKVIKPGMDTKQVIARFEAERQALALLDHPNIAHIFDAGTTEQGRPYFVMEYVKGVPITEHCDRERLSVEDRLQLFSLVCNAIQHAHQKGIIHRDIKPSNILVSVHEDKPLPAVIDFGVAKAIAQRLTEKTLFTEQGQLVGTPEYMSPEQAEMTNQDIDTRSDIYSLGVLLYELLTGLLPFDPSTLRQAAIGEIQRIIREEEPPRPSTKLSSLGAQATKVAEQRRTQVGTLTRRLQKELEWIPLKAIRKERTRRYRSVSELADDIENYLNGAPLIAGPESTVYRVRKFMRRYRSQVAIAGAFVLVLVVGAYITMFTLFTLYQARNQALEHAHVLQEHAHVLQLSNYASQIALAQIAYDSRALGRMKELLWDCPANLRGWEWYRLSFISDRSIQTLSSHADTVTSVTYSPNGSLLASGSADSTVMLWNVQQAISPAGHVVPVLSHWQTLDGHMGEVTSLTFASDGRRLASASYDGTVRVWDVTTGTKQLLIDCVPSEVFCVSFSPDGTRLVTGGSDNAISVWEAQSRDLLKSLPGGHLDNVYAAVFTPNGKQIVSCGDDRNIKVWDLATGQCVRSFPVHEDVDEVNALVLIADGKHVVSGGWDFIIKTWDLSTYQRVKTFKGHEDGIKALAYSAGERRIVSGSADDSIKVWDPDTGAGWLTLHGHDGDVESVAVSPHGRWIASGSRDHTIKLWDTAMPPDVLTLDIPPLDFDEYDEKIHAIDFSPDGRHIVSASGPYMGTMPQGNAVRIWDARSDAVPKVLRGHRDTVEAVTYSPQGDRIVSGSRDGTVRVWDPETGEMLRTLEGHADRVTSVSCSPDGKQIASGSWDGMIKVWNAETGKCMKTLSGHASGVNALDYSRYGDRIVSGGKDNTVKVWNPTTGKLIRTLKGHGEILSVAFSSKGRQRILSGSASGMLEAWNAATGVREFSFAAHMGSVMSVAFSPDGARMIAGGTDDYRVKIWHAETRDELLVLRGHSSKVSSVVFSPDGSRLASGSHDQTIRIWETNPGK